MTRRAAIVAAVAALLGLSCPVGAAGAPFTPELTRAYDLAAEWWGGAPNCASVERQIVPAATLESWLGTAADGGATIPDVGAPPSACRMWISRAMVAPRRLIKACALVFHEYGHLLGLVEHDYDTASIMDPDLLSPPPICTSWGLRELGRIELAPIKHARRAR